MQNVSQILLTRADLMSIINPTTKITWGEQDGRCNDSDSKSKKITPGNVKTTLRLNTQSIGTDFHPGM